TRPSRVVRFREGGCSSACLSGNGRPSLSWPSSLAVVAVSFSGLFTFVFLMLACLCCKKGDISFKEFENPEGEEYQADMSTLASPGSQDAPDVYILPLTEVSLPMAKQPARSSKTPFPPVVHSYECVIGPGVAGRGAGEVGLGPP
uniref:Uncharacterized protein n=1 Tax=Electrophorus electricus TaxID=8005 RepID=A0AAY5EPW0_ELEEL